MVINSSSTALKLFVPISSLFSILSGCLKIDSMSSQFHRRENRSMLHTHLVPNFTAYGDPSIRRYIDYKIKLNQNLNLKKNYLIIFINMCR